LASLRVLTRQTALIQVPGLVFFSAILNHMSPLHSFILVFPSKYCSCIDLTSPVLNMFAIILSTLVVNYISMDGTSNYFQGTALVIVYVLMVLAFFFVA